MSHLCSDCLKIERKRLKFTQQTLATAIDVSDMTIKRWETGTAIPSDKLSALAMLGFDVLFILTGQRNLPILNPKEEALLDNYRNSNEAGKKAVETTASAFAYADTSKKSANGG